MLQQHIATPKDVGFIASCLLYGARKGHYSFNANSDRLVSFMQQEIQSIISQKKIAGYASCSCFYISCSESTCRPVDINRCGFTPGVLKFMLYRWRKNISDWVTPGRYLSRHWGIIYSRIYMRVAHRLLIKCWPCC